MSLLVDIRKDLGNFKLSVCFDTDAAVTGLLGLSGSGKSVTLRCIAGIMTPDSGKIILDGVTLFDSEKRICLPPRRRRVGYLFQEYALFPHMTVRQNIQVCTGENARELLEQFHLTDVADKKPDAISGGQRQRTALARILASRPKAILLDEPFSALDESLRRELEPEVHRHLHTFGGRVLWVSHERGEIYRSCDAVCTLSPGVSGRLTTPEQLFRAPVTVAEARLAGFENLIPCPDGFLAVRARDILPHPEGMPCRVLRAVEDVDVFRLLLQPENAGTPLHMTAEKSAWKSTDTLRVKMENARPVQA